MLHRNFLQNARQSILMLANINFIIIEAQSIIRLNGLHECYQSMLLICPFGIEDCEVQVNN